MCLECLTAPLLGDLFHERAAVSEKTLVACTQVVQSRFAIRRLDEAVLRASAVAHGSDLTLQTISGECIQFCLPECSLFRTIQQFGQRSLNDISEMMFCIDKMIAREEIAIVFDNRNVTASRTENAQRMVLSESRSGCLFEYLDFDPADIMAYPVIEDGAEKFAPCVCWNGEKADAAFGVRLRIDHRQKGHISSSDLLEETVDFGRMSDIVCIHHAQDIRRDSVLLQEIVPTDGLIVGGISAFCHTVPVMEFPWTVQTETNGKVLCG